jgi:hypothetical protein
MARKPPEGWYRGPGGKVRQWTPEVPERAGVGVLPDLRLTGAAWRSLLWTFTAVGGPVPFGRLDVSRTTISISLLGFGTGPIERQRVQRIYLRRVCYFRVLAIEYTDGSVEPLGFAAFGQRSVLQQLADRGWPADLEPLAPRARLGLMAVEALVLLLNLVAAVSLLAAVIFLGSILG